MLTPAEYKLTAYLLKRASEEFSNHGCNDLNLVKDVGLTPEESFELRKSLTAWGDYPDEDVPQDTHYTMDWLAMLFIKDRILKPVPDGQSPA
jgi:hypothetical protein